jgi:hypothetical protein
MRCCGGYNLKSGRVGETEVGGRRKKRVSPGDGIEIQRETISLMGM